MNSFEQLYNNIDYNNNDLDMAILEIHQYAFFPNEDIRLTSQVNAMAFKEEHHQLFKELIVYASLAMNVTQKSLFEQMSLYFNLSQCLERKHFSIATLYYLKEHPELTLSGVLSFNNFAYYEHRLDILIDRITLLSNNIV